MSGVHLSRLPSYVSHGNNTFYIYFCIYVFPLGYYINSFILMTMVIRRAAPPTEESSSSDEEDAFSALAGKNKAQSPAVNDVKALPIVPATTSSMKRHHVMMSDTRKAKMDAILQDLEVETDQAVRKPTPVVKGSFVQPGEEHVTTNIFVSNLCPSLSEAQLRQLFSQIGPLFSLKVMWPRTNEDRSRNRLTAFVCFMHRADADTAMDAFSDQDPFGVGRRLVMRWGKSVRMEGEQPQQNVENSPTKRSRVDGSLDTNMAHAIRVTHPPHSHRQHFISTVATFVAQDGSAIENQLLTREHQNPDYAFLRYNPNTDETQKKEHIYYRWRVYSLCQGDSLDVWTTDPFIMIEGGKVWIPPPLPIQHRDANFKQNGDDVVRKTRVHSDNKHRDFVTGRQLERSDGRNKLSTINEEIFDTLVRTKLTASRQSICEATSFCFGQSGAAERIAEKLKELMMESNCSIDTRVARLYLLSDVLFNSQQPGIRNAFRYRDAIERMSPDIFASLGRHGDQSNLGRMRLNKLKLAVNDVLSAWTNWSVFDHTFIAELEARFEGREIVPKAVVEANPVVEEETVDAAQEKVPVVIDRPRGEFTEVTEELDKSMVMPPPPITETVENHTTKAIAFEKHAPATSERDANQLAEDDIDGEPLEDDDLDEETLRLLDEDYFISPDETIADSKNNEDDIVGEPVSDDEFDDALQERHSESGGLL